MKEIEILVEVLEDKKRVLEILRELKEFKSKGEKDTLDVYYQISEDKNPKNWFRIRKKGNKSFMTYKKDNYEGDKWIYSDEYETEVKNFKTTKEVIENLGFEELISINNKKYTFENKDYEIVLEEVENLGLFLEVERLNAPEDKSPEKIKKEIQNFIDSLGIKVSEEVNMGKPELMLNKLSKR